MSKKTFALVLTLVFVFALATSAFAAWGDTSYITIGQSVGNGNPHGPYDTTTKKCAVCHAVHGADSAGDRLLPAGSGNACVVCHIDTADGNTIVYDGIAANYTTASEFAHNNACENCHTVHGSGVASVTSAAGNLRGLGEYAIATTPTAGTRDSADGYTADMTVATNLGGVYTLTDWCSGCHPYFNTNYDKVSHVMTTFKANYATGSGATQVAWGNSSACKDCHDNATSNGPFDLNGGLAGKAFPHYTDGARFLNSAAEFGGVETSVTAGKTGFDAVCLKCHRDGATSGVGFTF